jgi:hypothetical protein
MTELLNFNTESILLLLDQWVMQFWLVNQL